MIILQEEIPMFYDLNNTSYICWSASPPPPSTFALQRIDALFGPNTYLRPHEWVRNIEGVLYEIKTAVYTVYGDFWYHWLFC